MTPIVLFVQKVGCQLFGHDWRGKHHEGGWTMISCLRCHRKEIVMDDLMLFGRRA